MAQPRHYVGPPLPISLPAYDYMRALTWRDWAWEGLRRNPVYQEEACGHLATEPQTIRVETGALLTRMHAGQPRAEAWALCSFR